MPQKKPRKYNDASDLEELCRSFLQCSDSNKGAAIQYCKDFLTMLADKPPVTGAVLSSRSKSR